VGDVVVQYRDVVAQWGMWWLIGGCVGPIGGCDDPVGGCGGSVRDVVAQRGCGGPVGYVVVQWGMLWFSGGYGGSVADVMAQSGMWHAGESTEEISLDLKHADLVKSPSCTHNFQKIWGALVTQRRRASCIL
jgi:hypothetical protein